MWFLQSYKFIGHYKCGSYLCGMIGRFLKRYRIFIVSMAVFSVVALTLFYRVLDRKTLPVYTSAMVNPELVDSTMQEIRTPHFVTDFSFVNQNGKIVTQKDYEGKIYVADFFFTTCQSICPKMTKNMVRVQEALAQIPDVKLLSHTVFPETDSVPVLKKYAIEHGVDDSRWNLVTGDKKKIYEMARKSYLVVKLGRPEELYDMVHTENFVLVDKKRRVRGFYDGTDPDEIDRLIRDIEWLAQN